MSSILDVTYADIAGMCLTARVYLISQKHDQARNVLSLAESYARQITGREMEYAANNTKRISSMIDQQRVGEKMSGILLDLQELAHHISTSRNPF